MREQDRVREREREREREIERERVREREGDRQTDRQRQTEVGAGKRKEELDIRHKEIFFSSLHFFFQAVTTGFAFSKIHGKLHIST